MKGVLLALVVVLLVCEVHGFIFGLGRGRGFRGRGGRHWPFRRLLPFGRLLSFRRRPDVYTIIIGGDHNKFPECKDFMKEVYDKMRESGSESLGCINAQDQEDCKFQELMKARMAVESKPSDECLKQVNSFMSGTPTQVSVTSTKMPSVLPTKTAEDKKDEGPPAKKAEDLPTKKPEGPPAKKDEGPPTKKDEGPPAKKPEGPAAKKAEGPPAKKNEDPSGKKAESPPTKKAEGPSAKKVVGSSAKKVVGSSAKKVVGSSAKNSEDSRAK